MIRFMKTIGLLILSFILLTSCTLTQKNIIDPSKPVNNNLNIEALKTLAEYKSNQSLPIAFNNIGNTLAFRGDNNSIELWDMNSNKLIHRLKENSEFREVTEIEFSADGNTVAAGGFYNWPVTFWDVSEGKWLFSNGDTSQLISSIAFSPDGEKFAQVESTKATIWTKNDSTKPLLNIDSTEKIHTVQFNSDGSILVTAPYAFGTVEVWQVSDGQLLTSFPNANTLLSPDGKIIAVSFQSENKTELRDVTTNSLIHTVEGNFFPSFSLDSEVFTTKSINGKANVWNISTKKLLLSTPDETEDITIYDKSLLSPDGSYLAIVKTKRINYDVDSTEVHIWDVDSMQRVKTLSGFKRVLSLAFSPNGKTLVVGSQTYDNTDYTSKISIYGSTTDSPIFLSVD